MKKTTKKTIVIVMMLIALLGILAGCTEADKVNYNLSKEADYFNVERKITVYNARTDHIILEACGYMSVSNDSHDELVVTCKVGNNEYKKNYVYLTENTLYAIEDISGTHTDPYHYEFVFHTDFPVTIETKR